MSISTSVKALLRTRFPPPSFFQNSPHLMFLLTHHYHNYKKVKIWLHRIFSPWQRSISLSVNQSYEKSQTLQLFFYSSSSRNNPIITANGTDKITPQNPIITAPSNADIMIKIELVPSCFSIKIGVIILFCTHWIARKITPAMSIPARPWWINANKTTGITDKNGPTYGIISKSPVINDNEKILGNCNPHQDKIQNAIYIDTVTNRER